MWYFSRNNVKLSRVSGSSWKFVNVKSLEVFKCIMVGCGGERGIALCEGVC